MQLNFNCYVYWQLYALKKTIIIFTSINVIRSNNKKWCRIKERKRKYVSLILIYFIFFLLIPKRVGCQITFGYHPAIFWRDVYILAQCFVLGYCLAIYCLAKQETVFVLLQIYWTCFVLIVVSHLKWEFPSCNMIGI